MFTFKKNCKSLQVLSILSVVIFNSFFASSQTMQMTIKNFQIVSANSFDYEVYVKNTSANTVLLSGYSWGLNLSPGIANGGTLTHTFLHRDIAINNVSFLIPSYDILSNQLKATTLSSPTGNEFSMLAGAEVMIGKMRVQTTASAWLPNFNPLLPLTPTVAMQAITEIGRVQCVALTVNSTTSEAFAIVGTGNTANQYVVPSLTTTLTPNPSGATPFILNPILDTTVLFIIKNFEPIGIAGSQSSFTYEVYAKNVGTESVAMRAYAWGLNPTNLPAGQRYLHTFLARDPLLQASGVPALSLNYTNNQLRGTNSPGASSYLLPANTEVLLAKCIVERVITIGSIPVVFPTETNPFNPPTTGSPSVMQITSQAGKTQAIITGFVGSGNSINLTSVGNNYLYSGITLLNAPKLVPMYSATTTAGSPFLLNSSSNLTLTLDHDVTCHGSADGVVFANATGFSGNFVYDIDGGTTYANTNGIFSGLAPGIHTICAKEIPSNLIDCAEITITEPDALTISTQIDATVSCLGNDGSITANVFGGVTLDAPYFMTWYDYVTTSSPFDLTVSGLAAGIYTVVAEDDNGCTASSVVLLGAGPSIVASASYTAILCNGGTSTITPTSTGGVGGLTNTISGGLFVVSAGSYVITATDAVGCTSTTTLIISDANQPCFQLSVSIDQHISCAGAGDGVLFASATGASGNFVYDIDGGTSYTNNTGFFTGLAPGSHTICAKEIPSNIIICETITLMDPDPLAVTLSIVANVSCLGNDGAITATVTGGTLVVLPSYLTTWYNNVNTNTPYDLSVSGLSVGTYTVVVEDDNGCTASSVIVLGTGSSIVASASYSAILCNGETTTITPTSTGGVGGLTNTISGGSFIVGAGSYVITASDAVGCTATTTLVISEPPFVQVGATSVPSSPICVGTSVTLNGTGAVTYTWNNGVQNGVTFTPTSTNTYIVTGMDANGCSKTSLITITVIPLPIVNANTTAFHVCAGNAITLTGSGSFSSGPPVYSWNNGVTNGVAFTPNATNTYIVTGSDANGCSKTSSILITVNPLPAVGATATPSATICAGTSVTLNGTGASSYIWNNSVINNVSFTPTSTNTYIVTGTDANGCTNTTSILITINPLPTVGSTSSPLSPVCAGTSITLNGTGASTYVWSGGITNNTPYIINATTTYTVTGTDANGCVKSATKTITVNPLPTVGSTSSPVSPVCAGTSVTLNGTGASTYVWTGGVINGMPFVINTTTTYTVIGTNANGCTKTAAKTITVNLLPNIGLTLTPSGLPISPIPSFCVGTPLTLTGTGGISYTWNNGVVNGVTFAAPSYSSGPVGLTYIVTGSDANGCTNTSGIYLSIRPLPIITGITSQPSSTICAGTPVTLSVTAVTSYYPVQSIIWNNGVINGIQFVPTSSNIYTVTVTSAFSGCTTTATKAVTVNPLPTIGSTTSASSPVCAGTSVSLNGTGAIAYAWSGGVTNNTPFLINTTTTYVVTGTDVNSCTNTATNTITVNPTPTITSLGANPNPVCQGSMATLTATSTANIVWSGGVSNNIPFTPNASSIYTVTATGANSCTKTATVSVAVNSLPSVGATASITTPICAGTLITLNGTGASTYLWSGGVMNGNAFAPSATTTYTVTGTAANGCTNTASITVVVNQATAHTTVVATCNTGYLWLGPLGDGILHNTSGTFTHVSVNANNCQHTETLQLTIMGIPTITANTSSSTLCAGSAISINAFGGITYTWTPGSLSGATINPSPLATTIYTVTGTNAGGCTSMATVLVNVNPTANVNPIANQLVCTNGSTMPVNFTGALPNTIYKWTNSNPAIGLAANGIGNISSFIAQNNGTTPITSTITVTPLNGNSFAYIANKFGYVTPISTLLNTASANIGIPGNLFGICVSPNGNTVYTTSSGNGNVYTINSNIVTTIAVGGNPTGICISPDGNKLYTANGTSVSVVNLMAGNAVSILGSGLTSPNGICISPDGNKLFVANGKVSIIPTNGSPVSTITTLGSAVNCVVSPDGGKLFVANGNNISVYNLNAINNPLLATVSVGLNPYGLCFSPDGSKLYISNSTSNNVVRLNTSTHTLIGSAIAVGTSPRGISITPDEKKLFVANAGTANVSIINLTAKIVEATIPLLGFPWSLGNFITGSSCQGVPMSFTITVKPSSHVSTVSACSPYTWPTPLGNGAQITTSGTYANIGTDADGCQVTETLQLTIVNPNAIIQNTKIADGCYTWPINGVTYYQTGNYTFNETVPCPITHTLNLTINQGVKLAAKVFLAGCYSTTNGLMNDDLRFKNLIPSNQSYIPFISAYAQIPPNSTLESIPIVSPAILSITGSKAIVDWVFLELRDPMNASVIVRTKRALLQRDGNIVSCLDGVSPVFFENTPAGNYYIVVRHRNHLGVMSANTLSLDPCLVATIDFTSLSTMVYEKPDISTNPPQKYIGNGIMAMWAGDANFNKKVQFNGTNNDKNVLLLAAPTLPILNQYRLEDLNLDGNIYNSGPTSDRNIILMNTLNSVSNAIYSQHTP